MRDYKFRGKRLDNDKWVIGYLYIHEPPLQCCPSAKEEKLRYFILQTGFADWNMPRPIDTIEVDPSTVGEFTSLKDKNGVEIFEGDIGWDDQNDCYGVVEFSDGNFSYVWENICTDLFEIFSDIEFIGSIHDNPELLKDGEPHD